jgi:hypothetical protein
VAGVVLVGNYHSRSELPGLIFSNPHSLVPAFPPAQAEPAANCASCYRLASTAQIRCGPVCLRHA